MTNRDGLLVCTETRIGEARRWRRLILGCRLVCFIYGRNGCGLCDVQCSGFCETPCSGGNVERRVVSVVGICSNQLHEELGVRRICCRRLVGRSFSVDDGAQQIIEGSAPSWSDPMNMPRNQPCLRGRSPSAEESQGADADPARVRARTAYGDFLTLAKDADRDIPVLAAAKIEYVR